MNLRDAYYSVITPSNYIQFGEGNTNILLTAPHGGGMKPMLIPKRKTGVLLQDTYTRRLTKTLVDVFSSYEKPYYLIADIHRSRVDLNRNLSLCCDGNWRAEKIWKEWEFGMNTYTTYLRELYNKSLYVDIHSHNDGDYFELGYNLSAKSYLAVYNNKYERRASTLTTLNGNLYEMLFGDYSIKKSLEYSGYTTLMPTGNEVYFNGGRNVEHFSGNGIGAVQIEVPISSLKTENDIQMVALGLYEAILIFKEKFVD